MGSNTFTPRGEQIGLVSLIRTPTKMIARRVLHLLTLQFCLQLMHPPTQFHRKNVFYSIYRSESRACSSSSLAHISLRPFSVYLLPFLTNSDSSLLYSSSSFFASLSSYTMISSEVQLAFVAMILPLRSRRSFGI